MPRGSRRGRNRINILHVDTTQTITHVGLCTGYGGIELGLKRVLPALRTVALCEIEAFAIANLVAKMEAGLMDPAPIWTDLKTFPWEEFRDKVDVLSGGYPCQPFSAAGKRLGTEDPRHLWPWIADGIAAMRPRMCFFENVQGHVTMGLSTVISDLEEMGYKVSWGIFSAAECGLPHKRTRVFIFANSMCERGQLPFKWKQSAEQMPGSKSATWRTWKTWAVKPTICGNDDGTSNRVDRLRLLGNGAAVQTVEKAFRTLCTP
jgi:site-specific DNA-cytosine methylase